MGKQYAPTYGRWRIRGRMPQRHPELGSGQTARHERQPHDEADCGSRITDDNRTTSQPT
jgi:hypothetical protein